MKSLLVFLLIMFIPSVLLAKGGNDQNQIILLNDSAAALEESDPEISKNLTKFADDKEKEWELENANKDASSIPVVKKDMPSLEARVKLLKAAALAIQPTYPLIAQGLNQMEKDLIRSMDIAK